jgi:hypothetical protein
MSIGDALDLMAGFASRTGLAPGSPHPPRRYLWTDAFAVCNFLELARVTGDGAHTELALRLVDQVHDVLGRARDGSARLGEADDLHPTRGGLRIGKPLPEREAHEPFDARLEWERDGQYFHYLTKWMHALDQAARATGRAELNLWARELAMTAYLAFTRAVSEDDDAPRMAWKLSTDLSRALVPSMGHHDPLDGLVTYVQLQDGADSLGAAHDGPDLEDAIRGFRRMLEHADWVTDDPLGIGGLLTDACRVQELAHRLELGAEDLALRLVASAFIGLRHWAGHTELRRLASERLAFRELGLCIGLHAVEMLRDEAQGDLRVVLEAVARFVPLARTIEAFWIDPKHRGGTHRDIDDVMLATSLLPGGFLRLSRADHSATAAAPDAGIALGSGVPLPANDSALRAAERSSNRRPR